MVFSSACGASSRVRIPILSRSPMDAAGHRIDRALQLARERVTSQSFYKTAIRYNPATCDCPSWEAELFGHWQRVDLIPVPTRQDQQLTRARIELTGEHVEGSTGWRYPVLHWMPILDDSY